MARRSASLLLIALAVFAPSEALLSRRHSARREISQSPRHTLAVTQLTKGGHAAAQWAIVAQDLWASLVIRASNASNGSVNGSEGPPDFEAGDDATQATFVTDCVVVFNVSDEHLQKDVVQKMCRDAKGTADECQTMVSGLWKAYNASDLEPWCVETYEWFEAKTKPKCLNRCKALLCKDRCDAHDKLRDLQDEATAYAFKLNQTVTRQGKLNMTRDHLKTVAADIDTYNKSNVSTALEQVTKFTATLEKLGDEMNATQKTFADSKDAKEAARQDLLAKRQDNSTSKADIEAAEKALNSTTEAFNKALKEKTDLNAEMVDIQALVSKAVSKYDYRQKRLGEMELEYGEMKTKIDSDYDEVEKRRQAIVDTLAAIDEETKVFEDALAPQLAK